MKLQNGYKVIYEKIAAGERTFFADKLDGTAATQIGDAIKVGAYKLVYEKDGGVFGSTTGKLEDGVRLGAFDTVFVANTEPAVANVENEKEPEEQESGDGTEESGEESGEYTDPEIDE